jgi:hypothetical protein
LAAVGLSLALAGCGTGSGTGTATGSASASSTASPSGASGGTGSGGRAAGCVVGTWKATGVDAAGSTNTGTTAGTVSASVTGGAGTLLTVGAAGDTAVDFANAQPITFAATVGGGDIKGSVAYGGKVTGTVQASGTGDSGTFKPVGPVDFATVTVTVDLTSPVQARIFDKAKVADLVGAGSAQTGGAVDAQPVLRESTYDCSPTTLKLTATNVANGVSWTWAFTRA